MQNPLTFQLYKTAFAGGAAFLLLLAAPFSVTADEPVALTPVAELPDKPDIEALAEELRTLGPEERRERLSRLREKYGAREEPRTPRRRSSVTDPRARLKQPFPDRAAHTNALAQVRKPVARSIDPVMLLKIQQQQLSIRLRQYKDLGTNAPVELAARIEQLEDLNRRIDERLKVLKTKSAEPEPEAKAEEPKEGSPRTGEAERLQEESSTEEDNSEK